MVVRATGINPEMLRWARERAGYSIEEVARRRRVPPERVKEWESGESFPTWKQLEQLAYQDYHRGTVLFLLNDPPEEKTVTEHFPRLPAKTLTDLYPDTLYAVRQAQIRQDDLAELLGLDGEGERLILRDLRGEVDFGNPDKLAVLVREYLGVDLNDPEGFSSRIYTFEDFRNRIEDAGIWVFKRSFRQKDVAGLCLGDDIYPVIYVGNGLDKAREIFALFSELAHLLFDFNYLERADKRHYIESLLSQDRSMEEACLEFAKKFAPVGNAGTGRYSGYHAGLSLHHVNQSVNTSRGYYDFQKAYLGKKYIKTVFSAFEDGRIDELDIASYLGVRGRYLDELEDYACRS